ncbi:hypothetical protein V5N11_029746 [Cardamine amara subsp. amara]|uniref:Reverse transcriptase domain-containing protein n=1 Tax=Cardamine amara subsp. amara TaxID=228776 RepID=A0ABD1BDP1_CARAN
MNPDDQEKTSFITDKETYCYEVMPFGLKNARATYQRLVNKMFDEQLGKTMEVYVDDILGKSLQKSEHIQHLDQCFKILNEFCMKLNLRSALLVYRLESFSVILLHSEASKDCSPQ